jgi:hypothetical protein
MIIGIKRLGAPWGKRIILGVLAVVIFATPVIVRAERNAQNFGSFSLAPVSSAYLMARWAPIIPCPTPSEQLTPAARLDLEHACTFSGFGQIPGRISENVFGKKHYPDILKLDTQEQRLTQRQIGAAVHHAMFTHPVAVAQQVGTSIAYQAFGAPLNDLDHYRATVRGKTMRRALERNEPGTRALAHFIGTTTGREYTRPPLYRLLNVTNRWPQYLLWADLALGAVLCILALVLRRRPSKAWLGSSKVLIVLACIGFVLGEMLNIALGAFAVFRYLFPLVPWLIGLLALGLSALVQLAGRTQRDGSDRVRTGHGA